jgi:fumarate reductase subunit D
MLKAKSSRLFSYVSVPILIFFLIPGNVVFNNLDKFYFVDASLAIIFSLFSILAMSFALVIIEYFLIIPKWTEIFHHVLKFLFIFLFLTGLYLPLSSISGMAAIDNAPIIWSKLVAAVILTLVIFSLSCSRFRVPVNMGIMTLFVLNIFVSAYGFFGLYSQASLFDEARENFRKLSERRNIIVISFDGIPRGVAARVLQASAELRSMFSDFRFFTNVIGSSPATYASISAEMYGNRDFKTLARTEEELRGLDVPNIITNKLGSHGYNVSTYGAYSGEFQNLNRILRGTDFLDFYLSGKTRSVLRAYDHIIVLIATRYTLIAFNKTGIKDRIIDLVAYVDSHLQISRGLTADEKFLLNRISNSHGEQWDRPLIKTIMAQT